MNSEKDFKNILNDKLESHNFSFDEANWNGANKLLDEYHKKEKKRRLIPFIWLFGLFLGTWGVYVVLNPDDKLGEDISSVKSKNINAEVNENAVIKVYKKEEIKNAKPSKLTVTKHGENFAASTKDIYRPAVNNSEIKSTSVTRSQNDNSEINEVQNENVSEKDIVYNQTNSASDPVKNEEYEPLQILLTNINDSAVEPGVNFGSLSFDENVKYKRSKHLLGLEGGVNCMIGWNNHGTWDAGGINPLVGINYSFIPGRKIYWTFGMQYYSIGHLSYSNHVSKITRYSLGEESHVTVITPSTLYFVALPIKVNYKFNSNYTFGGGVNLAYLLDVKSEVETYDLRVNAIRDYSKNKARGYVTGFSPFDVQLSFFVKRKLFKGLSANAGIFYGIIDQKSNGFFNSTVSERNKGVTLTLTYDVLSW